MNNDHSVRRRVWCGLAALVASLSVLSAPAAAQTNAEGHLILDRDAAMWLVALPLSCIDKLHEPPRNSGYLYAVNATLKADFAKTRAFYGCSDWHSAVNSTWTMVRVLKAFPDISVGRLIREKLNEHLAAGPIKGEIAYFNEEGNRSFERPYGWAWLLRLYGELRTWDDPDAKKWAENVKPLATLLLERTTPYLETLAAPMRIGTHGNTAFALKLLLEYARTSGEKALEQAVVKRSLQFFADDAGCAPNVEVSGSDFFSPCLQEAALMAQVMPPAQFGRWLDGFLPSYDAPGFKALTVTVLMEGSNEELEKGNMLGAKAHLIGLAVSRAKALEEIAAALPADDPRVPAYRRLASGHARSGLKAMYEAAYAGTHWIGTYLVDYMISAGQGRLTVPAAGK